MKSTRLFVSAVFVATLCSASAFATVAYHNLSTGQDGLTYCYASNSNGSVPADEPAGPAECCAGGLTFHNVGTGQDGLNYCYASNADGSIPADEPASPNTCCVWN